MSDGAVRLTFPAKPDYLLLARLALSGLTRDLPVGDELLADLDEVEAKRRLTSDVGLAPVGTEEMMALRSPPPRRRSWALALGMAFGLIALVALVVALMR